MNGLKPDVTMALRYLGAEHADPETRAAAEACAENLSEALQPVWAYRAFPLDRRDGIPVIENAGVVLEGRLALDMLRECGMAVLLVCTLGARFDAMLRAEQARDMAAAVVLDACGSAFVEAGCDAAEREIDALLPGKFRTDRFSPGYGDLPLALQGEILRATDAYRRLGVQANRHSLLIPLKTVTAVIGISDRPQPARIRGCVACTLREECAYREGGNTCAVF